MQQFDVWVLVQFKESIHDPQGNAVKKALHDLGFTGIDDVRIGKSIKLKTSSQDEADARGQVEEACKKLLANPVIEDYSIFRILRTA
ncbi:MAG: hypothetical protein A3F26_03725 [Candidatus Ryanbacteria bacterium RIFCSPHIGHO2_12_FULL_47_12b]|uniref:Phosphoribosylformylglycinamidine synthase subunit PurS n=1 Tax=Candidatus Ryanbacteria bacterium RIFCSPLOWO2_02_FULL_47_14 TaxID=1802129 RepID=A0A1G2H370_9BACT|nr:MAG: Phosphoribosylformylglycinamidine synthetase,PurS component [Parcubacteria group bacterium GW2011_GWA2_47_10b]KKU86069.1 MAG: Phosphoribosylformylglycinamidine synthetase,PurS component [Parcubacteria group bacterium GW2011_GWA1_47_9]OGZ48276.1 MAG: hypothetical protein A3C83_00215 [Candidatus Ryanbacteria bacterium RIFCSPHIGHO2_02_FULL_47_25]OGZ52198.1 MAG: hypothetical protein A3A29_02795 [Candidatus Ryanbacteria bacterium RIFCSPLOWO2_01_FULL_47_79]OGZ52868.1 MAG: hypothetical protein